MTEKIYKLSDFAKQMGASLMAVIKRIMQGKIRAINIHDRWYVPESELETLIKGAV